MKRAAAICLILACLPLLGCANLRGTGKQSATATATARNTSPDPASKWSAFSLAGLWPGGPSIAVVKVREKDLQDLPTGRERALAFQNSGIGGGFWMFGGPVDFKEPTLPESGGKPDGSLLPPKVQ